MALTGDLKDADVPSLIELARQGAGTSRLRLNSGSRTITLFVTDGEVVHADTGDAAMNGAPAVKAALACTSGTFELEKGLNPPVEHTIVIPWNTLLIQTLQHLDETRQDPFDLTDTEENLPMAGKEKIEDVIKERANDLEPGLRGIGVVGSDGLGIAFHKLSGESGDMLGSQMALIMQLSKRSIDKVEKGDVEDVLVTTDKSYMLGRFMGDGHYFMVVNVDRDSVLGNVRLTLRNYSDRMYKAVPGTK